MKKIVDILLQDLPFSVRSIGESCNMACIRGRHLRSFEMPRKGILTHVQTDNT